MTWVVSRVMPKVGDGHSATPRAASCAVPQSGGKPPHSRSRPARTSSPHIESRRSCFGTQDNSAKEGFPERPSQAGELDEAGAGLDAADGFGAEAFCDGGGVFRGDD